MVGMVSRKNVLGTMGMLSALALAPTIVPAQTTVKLRVGAATNDTYGNGHFGWDAGIFQKYGFDLELIDLPNAQAQVVAAAGGALDCGMADMIQLAAPIEKGVQLAYFAGGSLYRSEAPQTLLCVAKDSPIKTAKDFEGQTIGVVALNSISSMSVTEWLKRGGADVSKVKIFELPFSTMVPGIVRGTVAGVFLAEPFVSGAKNDLRILASTYDTIAKQFYIGAWFGPREWQTKNPELLRRLTAAIYDVQRWCNTHHDETAVTLARISKLDIEKIHAMARCTFATSLDPKQMQPVIDLAVKYGLLANRVDAATLTMRA